MFERVLSLAVVLFVFPVVDAEWADCFWRKPLDWKWDDPSGRRILFDHQSDSTFLEKEAGTKDTPIQKIQWDNRTDNGTEMAQTK